MRSQILAAGLVSMGDPAVARCAVGCLGALVLGRELAVQGLVGVRQGSKVINQLGHLLL